MYAMHAACPAHPTFLDFIALIVLGEEYKFEETLHYVIFSVILLLPLLFLRDRETCFVVSFRFVVAAPSFIVKLLLGMLCRDGNGLFSTGFIPLLVSLTVFNPLKTEFLHNFICTFSSYLTGNTSRLRHKAQPVNAVWGNSRCLL
jgi:hypothetical protein